MLIFIILDMYGQTGVITTTPKELVIEKKVILGINRGDVKISPFKKTRDMFRMD